MNLETASLEQLKAAVYDQLAARDGINNNINILNAEIAKRVQVTPVLEPAEVPAG